MSTTAQPNKVQNHQQVVKIRDHPRSLRMNDDTTMIKQIHATHAPDGREVEVKPIVQVIEEVVKRCSPVLGALYVSVQELFSWFLFSFSLYGLIHMCAVILCRATLHKLNCRMTGAVMMASVASWKTWLIPSIRFHARFFGSLN